jgi:hypothetical protein
MDALEILKGYLPQWFVTGRSAEHINKKFVPRIKREEELVRLWRASST